MKKFRAFYRFIFFAGFLIALIVRINWIRLWRGTDMRRFIKIRQDWTKNYLLPVLGVRVIVKGNPPNFPCIVMSNHRSYLDPAIICRDVSGYPVSKAEVSRWPLLGKGAQLTGVLFLQRESPSSRKQVLSKIVEKVKEGFPVILFPEGTTHNLPHTTPLKRGAFQLAATNQIPIVPVALEFGSSADYWIGDDTFVPHFFERFGEPYMDVFIYYGTAFQSENAEESRANTQKWLDAHILELRAEFY
jgi:1-acyl-sn-glycerol-3-phosphate acyltransferase